MVTVAVQCVHRFMPCVTADAKQQLATLSDDERRAQAAQLALRFAAMLGAGSSDEEDEGEGAAGC